MERYIWVVRQLPIAPIKSKGRRRRFVSVFWLVQRCKKINNKYTFINGTDKHVIWGYLQVGEIQSISEEVKYEDWKDMHPHYYYRHKTKNTAYISTEKLGFNNSMPGYG